MKMETENKKLEFRRKVRLPEVMSMKVEDVHERINNDHDIIKELMKTIIGFKNNGCLLSDDFKLIEEYDEFKAAIAAKEKKRKCRAKTL